MVTNDDQRWMTPPFYFRSHLNRVYSYSPSVRTMLVAAGPHAPLLIDVSIF